MKHYDFNIIPRYIATAKVPNMLKRPIETVLENLDKYGDPYGVRMGKELAIVTTQPAIIQHFLQKNHRNYTKSKIQTRHLATFLGKSLLTLDGVDWLRQRRLIQPGFSKQKIKLLEENMENTAEAIFTSLKEEVGTHSKVIDINPTMMRMAFMIVSNTLFGGTATQQQLNNIRDAVISSQETVVKLIRLPFFYWLFRHTLIPNSLKKVNISFKDLQHLIQLRRETSRNDDLLDMLLEARYEDTGEPMSEQQLIYELLVLFVAGHETTANALNWAIYLLGQHPEIVEKLRSKLGSENEAYLDQVISETLRMYPPAWVVDRQAINEDVANGITIPAQSMLLGFIYGTHHHTDYWDNPYLFNPDRFNPENKHAPYTFLPFGGGPRLCIGMGFSMMEMRIVLKKIVTYFDIEVMNPQEVRMQPLVTLGIRNKLLVKLKRR